jgi:hypothetical protein
VHHDELGLGGNSQEIGNFQQVLALIVAAVVM